LQQHFFHIFEPNKGTKGQENHSFSRVNEGFYFLILRNSSDFDDFFLNVCIYILFEIRNILVGARKYLYCLNNNLLFMEKIPFCLW
jgi:hypothetical protein